MWSILQTPEARYVLMAAVLFIVLAIGLYLIRKVRPGAAQQFSGTSELITNFRELYAQGKLSEEEYRTIKAKLAGGLEEELRSAATDEQQETPPGEAPKNSPSVRPPSDGS